MRLVKVVAIDASLYFLVSESCVIDGRRVTASMLGMVVVVIGIVEIVALAGVV